MKSYRYLAFALATILLSGCSNSEANNSNTGTGLAQNNNHSDTFHKLENDKKVESTVNREDLQDTLANQNNNENWGSTSSTTSETESQPTVVNNIIKDISQYTDYEIGSVTLDSIEPMDEDLMVLLMQYASELSFVEGIIREIGKLNNIDVRELRLFKNDIIVSSDMNYQIILLESNKYYLNIALDWNLQSAKYIALKKGN